MPAAAWSTEKWLAALGVAVARDKTAISRRDALAQTEEKYWHLVGLLEKERTLRAYESIVANLQIQAADAVAAGLATPNDELKVSLRQRQTQVDRLRLESGLRLCARDLRRHIGLPEADTIALADSAPPPPLDPLPLAGDRRGGAGRRLEIRLLERAVEAERLQTSLKVGEMLPTVSVGAQLFRYEVSGLGDDNEALVFGMVSVPITGTWRGAHEALARRQKTRAAEIQLADTRELVGIEIDKSWDELHASWVAVQVAEAAVEQAQVLRHQALEQRIDARSDFWLNRSVYLRAAGIE